MVPTVIGTLRVSEIFTSIQGEGPAAGQYATFLRLSGCNLSCSWCDTPYTWDTARGVHESTQVLYPDEVLSAIGSPRLLILTGGEPLLQRDTAALRTVIDSLPGQCTIHVETNGTVAPSDKLRSRVGLWVVSPKLTNAGPHRGHQTNTVDPVWASRNRPRNAHLKFVCENASDVEDAVAIADSLSWPRESVWVMPEGTQADVLLKRWPDIADAAIQHGINATQRLHVLAWGETRGA